MSSLDHEIADIQKMLRGQTRMFQRVIATARNTIKNPDMCHEDEALAELEVQKMDRAVTYLNHALANLPEDRTARLLAPQTHAEIMMSLCGNRSPKTNAA